MTWPTIPFPLLALAFAVVVLLLAGVLLVRSIRTPRPRPPAHKRLRASEFGEWTLLSDLDLPSKSTAPVLVFALTSSNARTGDHRPICALAVQNNGTLELDRCLVQMEQFSGEIPERMPMPLVLRTEGQIASRQKGRFELAPEQMKRVPILFRSPPRTNELYFFDEDGHAYLYPPGLYRAGPISMVIGVYGGRTTGKALVLIGTTEHGKIHTELKVVADTYKLPAG